MFEHALDFASEPGVADHRALLAARRLRVRLVVIARDGSVHYAGSFSKVLSPALRLGYLVVPDGLVDIFSAVKSAKEHLAGLLEV